MCTSRCTWDNDLVNRKEEQMKPIKVTKQDQFGFESSRGVYGPMDAALSQSI